MQTIENTSFTAPIVHFIDNGNQESSVVGELLFLKVYPSGWAIGSVRTDGGKISVNGNALKGLKDHGVYEFYGKQVNDPKWGLQFKVTRVSVHIPQSKGAIVKYLTKNYSGIGQKTAEKYINHHLSSGGTMESLRQLILDNPFAVDFSGVTNRKAKSKDKGGVRDAIYRQLASRLGGLDTSDGVFRALAAYYEKRFENSPDPVNVSWSEFSRNPYLAIRDVSGYGFLRADALGRKLDYPSDAPQRIAALATFSIDEGCQTNGHTFLTLGDFKEKIGLIDPNVDVLAAIDAAQSQGEPVRIEGDRYYIKKYYDAEKFLSIDLYHRRKDQADALFNRTDEEVITAIKAAASGIGIRLDESQMAAVVGLLTSKKSVHTITAGPGCGKTAIMEVVVAILIKNKNVGFCAPTGKAAKVLNSRVHKIGASASTIHSMLGIGEGGGFAHGIHNKLDFDLLVVDECSMVDVALMNSLMSAVKAKSHVVFLGDDKQLPSVGPGNCLIDILKMDFDHHRLTKTHRNHGGILEVVNLAGSGFADFRQRDDVHFIEGLPDATQENVQNILNIFDRELTAVGGDFSQVGLLIARRKGDINNPGWNTTYLNHRMRETYNPHGEKVPGTTYRINDRVIIRKNLSITYFDPNNGEKVTHAVVNGDTGYIRNYIIKDGSSGNDEIGEGMVEWLVLELDDGRVLQYESKSVGSLDLAYAMTVHSAQGSEYKRLITICVNGAPNFIHRGILFTAWSRAQENLTIVGDFDAISSILRRAAPKRNSFLQ